METKRGLPAEVLFRVMLPSDSCDHPAASRASDGIDVCTRVYTSVDGSIGYQMKEIRLQ